MLPVSKSASMLVERGVLSKCKKPLGVSVMMKKASVSVRKSFTVYPCGSIPIDLIAFTSLSDVAGRRTEDISLSAVNCSCRGMINFVPRSAIFNPRSSTKPAILLRASSRDVSF